MNASSSSQHAPEKGKNEKVGKLIKSINRAAQQLLPGSRSGGGRRQLLSVRRRLTLRRESEARRPFNHPSPSEHPAVAGDVVGFVRRKFQLGDFST